MPLATIHKLSPEGDLYHIHFMHQTDPGFGGGRPGGPDPGWGQGHPGHHPGNRPPGSGSIPDNELPDHPPPHLMPGYTLVMVRGPHGKWEYAAIDPGQAPPRPLPPGNIEHPGNRPPGSQPPHVGGGPMPGNPPTVGGGPAPPQPIIGGGPMPGQPPHPSGQPVPPQPTPQHR